jgi:hypothetical protein
MVARALKSWHAPAFDGACDNDESLTFLGQPGASPKRRQDCLGVVTVYDYSCPPEGFGFVLQMRPILLARDKVALAELVAVEQSDDVREALVPDEIHRLPDLTLA